MFGSRSRRGAWFDLLFPALYGSVFSALTIFLQLRYFPIGDTDLESDFFGDLVIAARNVTEGRFSVLDFPWKGPLYALVLIVMHGIAGDWYRGAIVLSAVSGGAYLALAYRLILRLFDRRSAILSVITAGLVSEFFVQSHRASTDVFFLFLYLGSVASTLLAGRSLARYALAGGLASLAFLTRYNGASLVLGAALVLFLVNPGELGRRRRSSAFAIYAGVFLLVCAPWFYANWAETGRILATRNAENVISTFYAGPRWLDEPATQARDLPALIASHPARFAAGYGRNLIQHLKSDLGVLLGWPLAFLPIAGVLGFVLRRPTRRQLALYAFAGTYWAFMGIVFWAPRFSLPLVLPYLVLGCSLLCGGGEWTRWGRTVRPWLAARARHPASWTILLALLLGLLFVQARRIAAAERAIYERRPLYILEAARSLAAQEKERGREPGQPHEQQHRLPRPSILARKAHIAYYAGFDFAPFSTDVRSLEELVQHARSRDVSYIAYSRIEYTLLPRLLFLAVTDTVPLLQEVYRGSSIRIFRLAKDTRTALSDSERYGLLLANLRAARAQQRTDAIYMACEDLGAHLMQRQEFTEAVARYQDALEVAERAGVSPGMAHAAAVTRHNLAVAQLALGRAAEAVFLLEQNVKYFAAHGSQNQMAHTHEALGRAFEMLGRREEARRERDLAGELRRE